jgi:hypothetical protein
MDGLRSQLADVRETLRDVVGRLDALEEKVASTAEKSIMPPVSIEVKQPMNVAGKPSAGTGSVAARKP